MSFRKVWAKHRARAAKTGERKDRLKVEVGAHTEEANFRFGHYWWRRGKYEGQRKARAARS